MVVSDFKKIYVIYFPKISRFSPSFLISNYDKCYHLYIQQCLHHYYQRKNFDFTVKFCWLPNITKCIVIFKILEFYNTKWKIFVHANITFLEVYWWIFPFLLRQIHSSIFQYKPNQISRRHVITDRNLIWTIHCQSYMYMG